MILTDAQKKVINIVGTENKLTDFYLSGGTALAAYYFQHRLSDDLDFFCFKEPDQTFLHTFSLILKETLGAKQLRFERLYDRNQFFFMLKQEELKIEFTRYPFQKLEESIIKDSIRIDSLKDIAANKLMALLDRFDPKDFVDLFFILQGCDLATVRQDSQKKFGIVIGDIFLGSELMKVKRISALPKMTKPLSINDLKDFFLKQAKILGGNIFQ